MLLLDTDVMVDIQRGFAPALEWLRDLPETPAVSVITVLELMYGCRNLREQEVVKRLVERMHVMYLDESACIRAVDYLCAFHLSSGLGLLDSLIAATAASRGLVLCSFNEKHYGVIPDLQVVKPYARDQEPRE